MNLIQERLAREHISSRQIEAREQTLSHQLTLARRWSHRAERLSRKAQRAQQRAKLTAARLL